MAGVVMAFPRFPVTVRGLEWEDDQYASPEELAMSVEYVDDTDPPYEATDAAGRPVRLIVWALELLLCTLVPPGFSRRLLGVVSVPKRTEASTSDDLLYRHFEVVGTDPRPQRCLVSTASGEVLEAEPRQWNDVVSLFPERTPPEALLSREDFHGLWMRYRLGRKWP